MRVSAFCAGKKAIIMGLSVFAALYLHGFTQSLAREPSDSVLTGLRKVTISTTQGGILGTEQDKVQSFKGIPFAQPPVGALRWVAPQPVADWSGNLDATRFRADCLQKPFPSDAAPLGGAVAEDCLYLNVWRPAPTAGKYSSRLPVMVWIYGGGFVNGGSSPAVYSGVPIAKQGVIVVSFNYRLGRFGTFDDRAFTDAKVAPQASMNFGFMDQLAALHWVKDHIAEFGGDPDRVTVVGESAGGMSVHMLLTSPAAGKLFSQAVIQSGAEGVMPGESPEAARAEAIAFAASHGIKPDDPNALEKLRALPADAIVDGLNMVALFHPSAGTRTFSSPVPDGKLIVPALDTYKTDKFTHIPVMIGTTSADFGGSDGIMIAGTHRVVSALARAGVPVYEYVFSYVASSLEKNGVAGAAHATDIPFFMGTTQARYTDATSPRDRRATLEANSRLVNFVKTGHPSVGDESDWPRFEDSSPCILNFTTGGSHTLQCH